MSLERFGLYLLAGIGAYRTLEILHLLVRRLAKRGG